MGLLDTFRPGSPAFWAGRKYLERFIRSDQHRIVLSVLESSSENPEVELHETSKSGWL